MSEATKPESQPEVDLLANAQELLERYRQEEADLERQRAELDARREVVRDVIASLTQRKRQPRARTRWAGPAVVTGPEMGETIETPEPMPPAA